MNKLKPPVEKKGCEVYAENPAWLTVNQARVRYNLSRALVVKAAEEANALVRIGRAIRIKVSAMEEKFGN